MKRACGLLISVLIAAALFVLSACGDGEKDEWDGVSVLDHRFCQTEVIESGIVNPPTVVCDISSKDAFERVTGSGKKPSSVILRLNDKFNVTDASGETLCSFSSLYYDTLKGRIIPVIYLSDESAAKRATELFKNRYDLLDAAVMSKNAALVNKVRSACPKVRGIVEFDELRDVHDAVAISTENRAVVAVIPESAATAENVFYIQARFKTVWVRVKSAGASDLRAAIDSGAYGIVSQDCESVIDALGGYVEGASTRKPFVAAHRGLPKTHNENSVAGCSAAVQAGATHIEIDGYLTRDDRIAVMHDRTIERTSDGSGGVEDLRLEQLRQFKLDLFSPQEPIPALDDILAVIKDTDTVMIFEIKSQKPAIVNALKTALEKSGCERQVVVLTSHSAILQAMYAVLPRIPTALLTTFSADNAEDVFLACGDLNAVIDAPRDGITPELNRFLRDRGFIGWYWTYETTEQMSQAVALGYTGLTTDVADEFSALQQIRMVFDAGREIK